MRYLITGGSGFIGTNLIDELAQRNVAVANVDICPPKRQEHNVYWVEQDILDYEGLLQRFSQFQPTHVIHLAARADTDGKALSDYDANIRGTEYVLRATKTTESVERVIITSTQFVHQNKGVPAHDQDFSPHTVYGESKVISEKLTRSAGLEIPWTIVRPTNVWGPWHPRYPHEFWRVLSRGLYVHPGGGTVTRSYGYVKNVAWQLLQMCEATQGTVAGRVFYVGDAPVDLLEWVNAFSLRMLGRKVTVVPSVALRALALLGDGAARLGLRSPITSSRLRSMTTSNAAPMAEVFASIGRGPYALAPAVDETVDWLYEHFPEMRRSGRKKEQSNEQSSSRAS